MKNLKIISALFVFATSLNTFAIGPKKFLSNKAPFFAEQDQSLPRNIFIFTFQGATESIAPEKQGVFDLLEYLIEEGPNTLNINEYKKNLFLNSTEIGARTDYGLFKIYVQAPPQNTKQALEILHQTLTSLRINPEDFSRLKSRVSSELNTSFESMKTVITYFAIKDLFHYSPEVMNGATSPTSFEKIELKDLKESISSILNYKNLFISYVGPTAEAQVKKDIESVFKAKLKVKYKNQIPKKLSPPAVKNKVYTLIHKENATDNQIFILYPQKIKYGSPAWYQGTLLQQLLGGGLGGELNKTLRVERGLTYGASSRLSGLNFPYWYISTFGGIQQTKPLLKGIDEVLNKFIKTPSEKDHFESSVEILLNAYQTSRELAMDRISSLATHYANHLDEQVITEFPKKLMNLKGQDVENFKKELQTQNAAYYLMGNKDILSKILVELGVSENDIRIVNLTEIR